MSILILLPRVASTSHSIKGKLKKRYDVIFQDKKPFRTRWIHTEVKIQEILKLNKNVIMTGFCLHL